MLRLNLGSGKFPVDGWINLDVKRRPGVDIVADLSRGLPLAADSIDAVAAIHVLQALPHPLLPGAAAEIRRVLKPGGALRAGLPDLDKLFDLYRNGSTAGVLVPDADWRLPGSKLVTHLVWYGEVRTPFTFDFAAELLAKAGFHEIERASFGRSRRAGLAALDNRERESLFIEAIK